MKQCTLCGKVYDDYMFCCPSCGSAQFITPGGAANGGSVQPVYKPKKKGKAVKITAVIVAVIIVLSAVSGVVYFLGGDEDISVNNGAFQDSTAQTAAAAPETTALNYYVDSDGVAHFETVDDAAEMLKNALVNREKKIKMYVKIKPDGESEDLSNEIYDRATSMEFATGSTDGDYLETHVKEYETLFTDDGTEDMYYEFTPRYRTSVEQEDELEEYCNQLYADLGLEDKSEYEQVKAIHDYLVKTITYVKSGDKMQYTAYAALIDKKCVCQGYATAFYRLCRMCSIDVVCVRSKDHIWNIVKVDGKYYYIDCTYDDCGEDGEIYYDFFLRGSKNAGRFEEPSDEYKTEEFKAKYPLNENDYPERPEDVIND